MDLIYIVCRLSVQYSNTLRTLIFNFKDSISCNHTVLLITLVETCYICIFQIKKALRGVKVEVTHRGNMRRKYRISGLTSQATGELT